jgi:hypothetical protein
MIELNIGDTIRNTVGLVLIVSKINEPVGTASLVSFTGETTNYNLHRLLQNIASGKWTIEPKKRYANWI